jgi:hypothetical protein
LETSSWVFSSIDFSAAATSSCFRCEQQPLSYPDFWTAVPRCGYTYNSEVLEWPGLLDVLQGSSQVLELQVDSLLGSLGVLEGLNLEGIDGLDLTGNIVGGGLEVLESLLDLVDDGLVLQDGAVGGEVDGRGLLGELLDLAARILVALLEGLQGRDGLTAEAQRAGDLGPVELESCASLKGERRELN